MLQIVRCDSGAVYNQSTKKVTRQGLFQVKKVYFWGGMAAEHVRFAVNVDLNVNESSHPAD
jgi:hypothetical protein